MYFIFVIFTCFIVYSQYKKINKPIPDNIEILQYNNPDDNTFENIVSENQPCVFTNILDNVELSKKNINSYFNYYLPDLCLTKIFEISQTKRKQYTKLIKQNNYRFFIYQIKGIQKVILFPKKDEKNLYLDKTRNFSNIDFWNLNPKVYPLINEASYLEIILRPRQMLVIPYGWWYTIESQSVSNSLLCKSETVFSRFLKKK